MLSNFELTTSSSKHIENISHAHIVFLMYKLLTSSTSSDDLSINFDRDRNMRPDELTKNKNIKSKYHLTIKLKDVFGFAEGQEKATCGLGYKLTLTEDKNGAALGKAPVIADARIKNDNIHWYVPHYTPSIQQQGILSKNF